MPTPGDTLGPDGRYVVERLLGAGGMADVYRARDSRLDRPVAIKLLRGTEIRTGSSAGTDADPVVRFRAEARTLARLNHPGLVPVLDAGATDDGPFLVLGLVDGPTLAQALHDTDGDGLPVAVVAHLGAQVAAALASCHAAGVVHRDVKPGNILLTHVGGSGARALLTDFGIARVLDDPARLTRTGFTVGTAAYLAPEQVRGESVTEAADVYSLGLVLIEALSGARCYPGPATEAAVARLHAPPRLPAALPADWATLLSDMTATDPADRPSAAEVAQRTDRLDVTPVVLGSVPGLDGAATQPFPAPTLLSAVEPERTPTTTALLGAVEPERRRPRAALLVAAAAVTAIVIGLGTLLVTSGDDEPATKRPVPSPTPSAATPSATPTEATAVTSTAGPTPTASPVAPAPAGGGPGKGKPGKVKPPKKDKPGKGKGP